MFDGFLAVEFVMEIPRESEVLPEVFEAAFECTLEHLAPEGRELR